MSQIPDNQSHSYIQTQFLFYLIPSYYGLLAFIWRQISISEQQPKYYAYNLFGQSSYQFIFHHITQAEQNHRNSDALIYKTPPASYVIKSKLCLLNAFLYMIMIVLSFISTSNFFYSANHKMLSFLYFFGFVAWYSAAFVLRSEYQRNISQSIWIHRLFWILAGTFSIYKMFEDYFLPLNLIFNILFIASNFVLAVYGIYRPQDTDVLQLAVTNEDIPGFAKMFFQMIELNELVRKVFGIEDQVLDMQLNNNEQIVKGNIGEQQLLQIGRVFKYSAQTIKDEINLLKELPRRNVFVDQKIRYIKINDRMKGCFLIITQIDFQRAESERTFEQFVQLYQQLKEIFCSQNFPKHQLPKFSAVAPSGESGIQQVDVSKRSQHIQKWLDEIFKTPIFMIKQVLQFLNVSKELSAPFTTYFEHSYRMFCSKHFILLLDNKKKNETKGEYEQQVTEKQFFNQAKLIQQQTDNEKLIKLMKRKLQFNVFTDTQNGIQQNFRFLITCLVDKKAKYSWSIDKTQEKILLLNQRIQDDCNCSVPSFYSIIASRQKSYKNKMETYKTYIYRLLANQKFIKFDPIGLEVTKEGEKGWWLKEESSANHEQIFQYEDKGTMVQVTRIYTIPHQNHQYTISFDLRRQDTRFTNKTTAQLQVLRSALLLIYRGVSFIPEIVYKHADKSQIKKSIQMFLLKIQNLPKIQINKDYSWFYQERQNMPIVDNEDNQIS